MNRSALPILLSAFTLAAFAMVPAPSSAQDQAIVKEMPVRRGMTEAAIECIACHQRIQPGIIQDWKQSRHGHVGFRASTATARPRIRRWRRNTRR